MKASDMTSIAVWDVPMPVVAGERFAIKVGANAKGAMLEVSDGSGVVTSGMLGSTAWPGTDNLCWAELQMPAPKTGVAQYTVRCGTAETWFTVMAAAKPTCTLSVQITERDSKAALDGVEIRLGPFHARTDKAGRATLSVCPGEYQLQLWRTAHIAQPTAIKVERDTNIDLTMVHVPEEHPDARWVR
jgi:hypothetical protein